MSFKGGNYFEIGYRGIKKTSGRDGRKRGNNERNVFKYWYRA